MKRRQSESGAGSQARERGTALVVVLGLVALIGAWGVNAAYEDMIDIRRAENIKDAIYASQASRSFFALAKLKLRRDGRQGGNIDDLEEPWAEVSPAWPVEHGEISGRIEDANRYFNLNSLVDEQGAARAEQVRICRRLFTLIDLDASLVDALVDWLDADNRPFGTGGAEAAAYLDRPYQVKNSRLDRWSELSLVRGFDRQVMQKLAAVATVHPAAGQPAAAININTARAALLMALFENMDESDADRLMNGRPYADVGEALKNRAWAKKGNAALLGVSSNVFIIFADVRFGRAVLLEKYLVARQGDSITLLARERLG